MSDNPRIEDLRRRVQRDPASIAFAQLAEEYRRDGLYDEAVQVCRAGLAIHPGYLSARVTLGRALLELGQHDSAQHELQLVLVSAPDNLAAIRGLADIYHHRGALPEALAHYRRALGLARNDPELEQTVADLVRAIAKRPAPSAAAPARSDAAPPAAGLLTLEQLAQELQANAALPVARPRAADTVVPAGDGADRTLAAAEAGGDQPLPAHAADRQSLAALEQWLTAIDGYRAERRA